MSSYTTGYTAVVEFEGKKWSPTIVRFDGIDCIKLAATDQTLVRFLFSIHQKATDKGKPSIAQTATYKSLIQCRNTAQAEDMNPTVTAAKEQLFGDDEEVDVEVGGRRGRKRLPPRSLDQNC